MKLEIVLENIVTKNIIGSLDKEIQLLSQDSRDESFKNGLYFAVSGTEVDGHDFIDEVIEKGTRTIVCEKLPETALQVPNDNVTYIVVENSKRVMGKIASNFYGNPSNNLVVIAVTGTNGKTSIANYIAQSLQSLHEKPILLSTTGDYFCGQAIILERKAPSSLEIIELHKILREYLDQGATHVCLEATSQALDQDRLSGINIDVAIFTNLGQDHLDYHGTVENYVSSKKLLFDGLKESALAISNYDDVYGKKIVEDTKAQIISYGSQGSYDYSFNIENIELGSITVNFNSEKLFLPVIGEFNIYNILSLYAVLSRLGYNSDKIKSSIESLDGVPGRMQQIENGRGILALVDYAHSPGALENVLQSLQTLPHKSIITVIGCGGDRDKSKRAPMVSITQKYSDTAIYTADNPRTEDLTQIFDDMKKGIDTAKENYLFIENREAAIKQAIENAEEGDVVLVAGKGHEDYQIIGTEKHHFDDGEVLERYLQQD